MRIVEKGSEEPLNFPGKCVFTGDSEGPFLDTDTWLNARDIGGVDPYGYIHVQKVIDMARVLGMVPKDEVEKLQARLTEYGKRLEDLSRLVAAYETLKDAERTLEGVAA